jgi:hypothetical protein
VVTSFAATPWRISRTRSKQAKPAGSVRLFSVGHEFPVDWAKFKSAEAVSTANPVKLALQFRPEHYPFWSQGKLQKVARADVFVRTSAGQNSIDIFGKMTDTGAADDSTKISVSGKLKTAQLDVEKMPFQSPISPVELIFSDKRVEDLWLAVRWASE